MSLDTIERCYDAIPRVAGSTEEVGPFTLFVAAEGTGWQFYARPRLGLTDDLTADDVRRVLDRQSELGLPRAVEWVDEVTPSLLPAVRTALPGVDVEVCPLLVLPTSSLAQGSDRCEVLAADHPHLPLVVGAVNAAFDDGETVEPRPVLGRPALIASGALVVVAAYDSDGNVVGGGSAAPRGPAAELMGIGVVGPARGQGHGTAITRALVDAVRDRGVETAFLSAASDAAASIYRAVGFERVGTALILEFGGD
jgi:ribosomal protein S18 acetylase RimI-like enzyme